MTSDRTDPVAGGLAPRWVRALVFAALVAIAVASIWLIDRRAMVIQARHGWPGQSQR